MYESCADGSDKAITRTVGEYTTVQCPLHVLHTLITGGCGVYIKGTNGEQVFQLILDILTGHDNYIGPIYFDKVDRIKYFSQIRKFQSLDMVQKLTKYLSTLEENVNSKLRLLTYVDARSFGMRLLAKCRSAAPLTNILRPYQEAKASF
jgi:hypothetical protein